MRPGIPLGEYPPGSHSYVSPISRCRPVDADSSSHRPVTVPSSQLVRAHLLSFVYPRSPSRRLGMLARSSGPDPKRSLVPMIRDTLPDKKVSIRTVCMTVTCMQIRKLPDVKSTEIRGTHIKMIKALSSGAGGLTKVSASISRSVRRAGGLGGFGGWE